MYAEPIGPVEPEKEEPIEIDTEVLCNCYLYTEQYLGIDLPPMNSIQPSTTTPSVGAVAVMWYGHVKHVAVVTAIDGDRVKLSEGNLHRCQRTDREIPLSYPRLVGFYNP
jgi:hypothetical protein